MISIVIPLYNKEKQVAHTLQSVFDQTFQDFEIVIVDDGSTDGSVAEVEKFAERRIRLIHQQNAGVSAARNRGVEAAKGELVAFLDADDEWKPEYLATQYHLYLKYPKSSVYACNYEFRNPEGVVTSTTIRKLAFTSKDGLLSNYFEVASCSYPPLWTSAVMVKKQAIQDVGGFPVGIKSGEDLLTWARLAVRGPIAYSKRVQAVYRQGYSNPRPPEERDFVGEQLEILFNEVPATPGLKHYVAFWYKMRMCRCLAHRMWKRAVKAFVKSLRYNPLQGKIYMSIVKYTLIGLK